MHAFHQVLGNNLAASVTNFTVWFALTFWVFLETQSVFATGMIAGLYLVFTAGSGFWLGGIVDHHRKKRVMMASSAVSFLFYALAFLILLYAGPATMAQVYGLWLWVFVFAVMIGVIAGNVRAIALSTLVTILVPEDRRDKANGLVGMVNGIGFLMTSVISGFLVAWGGMHWTLILAMTVAALAFLHLLFVKVPEEVPQVAAPGEKKRLDLKGTLAVVLGIPGLIALIFFSTFNNFLGGIFMALMDAYGLSLVPVQVWGLLFGALSCFMIVSGMIAAKRGLGKNPVTTLLTVNLIAWVTCIFFTIQPSIWLLVLGMAIWFAVSPLAEASEQTTLQKVVPLERQGRVFGFAQSIEQSASPLTAFLIGPLTQFYFMPLMTSGLGAQLIGDWFSTGPARGIALVFTLAGVLGVAMTLFAFNSKEYRQLSERYLKPAPTA